MEPNGRRPPALTIKPDPVVSPEKLAAIHEVRLMLGRGPRKALREFYERIIGLTFVEAEGDKIRFVYERRQIVLEQERVEPGKLGILVRNFGEALMRLRDHQIAYELIHGDGGLTRTAIIRDPAGNWIYLTETRPM